MVGKLDLLKEKTRKLKMFYETVDDKKLHLYT
jgi:hypothetical protein